MATFITSDQTTTFDLSAGGNFFVLADVTMRPTSGDVFSLGSSGRTVLTIAGDAFSDDDIWDALGGSDDIDVNITATGTVVVSDNGFLGSGDRTLTFNNSGEVITGSSAFYGFATNMVAINAGRITTGADAFDATFTDDGNSGEVTFSLTNTGTITNLSDTAVVDFADSFVSIVNEGRMQTNGFDAIRVLDGGLSLLNAGSIIGSVQAVGTGSANIRNTGEMSGLVVLSDLADTLVNTGTIAGRIDLQDGNDVYFGELGFLEYGSEIYLGAGDDELDGGMGRERVFDGDGNDDVSTGGGNDSSTPASALICKLRKHRVVAGVMPPQTTRSPALNASAARTAAVIRCWAQARPIRCSALAAKTSCTAGAAMTNWSAATAMISLTEVAARTACSAEKTTTPSTLIAAKAMI